MDEGLLKEMPKEVNATRKIYELAETRRCSNMVE